MGCWIRERRGLALRARDIGRSCVVSPADLRKGHVELRLAPDLIFKGEERAPEGQRPSTGF